MWFSPLSSRKSFKATVPPILLSELAGADAQVSEIALAVARNHIPSEPIPLTEDNDMTIKSMRGAPVKVNESLSLFVTTWNMAGSASIPESDNDIEYWIPRGHGLYAIALQECKRPEMLETLILSYLGGEDVYHSFKTKEMLGTTLLVFVDQLLYKSGVFRALHINGLTKHEVKSGKLSGSSSNGRGAICMRFTFHNTVIAFVACKLDSKAPDKREADLDFILKDAGVDVPEVQEIGTPALAKVHHVFLFGDFGTKIAYPAKSSLKTLVANPIKVESPWDPSRWERLLQYDELDELRLKNKCFQSFKEPEIAYPPTGWRRKYEPTSSKSPTKKKTMATPKSAFGSRANFNQSSANGDEENDGDAATRGAKRIAPLFEPDFNLDDMFDFKSGGVHTLPTYSDRIFFRSLNDFQHLVSFGSSGTAEGMVFAAHVPVFATFKVNGVDKNLLHSWQKITGNIPPEYATRADRHLVAGVVAQVQEIVQNQIAEAEEAEAKAERLKAEEAQREAEEIKTAPKCIVCNDPCLRKDPMILELPGDKKVHAKCFKCSICSKSLANARFYNIENKWLCEDDFQKLYVRNCPRCSKPVTSQFLKIGDSEYHIDCFTCSNGDCQKKLLNQQTGEFEPFDELGGKPYCMQHYKEMIENLTFCAACNRLIVEGEVAVPHLRKTMNGDETSYFHEKCFHCKVCGEDLGRSDKKFVISDGEMFCEPDFVKLFGPLHRPPAMSKDMSTGDRSVSVSIDVQSE